MKLGVVGLGKLGLPLAAVLAESPHHVIGLDNDSLRIEALRSGRLSIQEPKIQELLNRYADRLTFGYDPAVIRGAEIIFIVTPTPSNPDGAFSLEHVKSAILQIKPYLERDTLLVVVSTVMPGQMRELAELVDCGLCYNPQFVALGSVVRDLRQPDFVLIGADRPEDAARLAELYGNLAPIRVMDFTSAEVAKLALNCYVTMKISYANMLAEVCEAMGADALAVTQAIGLDKRIGPAYLRPGVAYGGPCFPRDNAAFIRAAASIHVDALLLEATDFINLHQTERLIKQIAIAKAQKVGVLGLAYKPGTSVYDDSAGMALIIALQELGYRVMAHDPIARPPDPDIPITITATQLIQWADTIVVMTPWPEYRNLDRQGKRTIDPWRLYDAV